MVLWCPQLEWCAQEMYRNIGLSLGAISVGWIGWRLDAWTTCSLEETLFCFSRAMVFHLAWILFVFVMSYRRTAPSNLKWKANPPEMVKTRSNRLKHSGKDTREKTLGEIAMNSCPNIGDRDPSLGMVYSHVFTLWIQTTAGDAMVGWPDSCLFRFAGISAAMGYGRVGRGNDPEVAWICIHSNIFKYENVDM